MTREQLQELYDIAIGALADIGFSDNMTWEMARKKAKRIHINLVNLENKYAETSD